VAVRRATLWTPLELPFGLPIDLTFLALVTLAAAIVNGAIGYGFSSITVPLALLTFSSRVLNPALVLVEVTLNLYVLFVNRGSAGLAVRRVWPIVLGLVPGVVVGSLFLASLQSDVLKVVTYTVLLPLIFVQAAGIRRPIKAERRVGVPFGTGLGVLYSVTTISGPPLALLLNNQGLARRDFRAALGIVRVAESGMTAVAYLLLGLYTPRSLGLLPVILPSVLIGVPLGALLIRMLAAETFRRVTMSFDAWIVGFGLSRVVEQIWTGARGWAYLILAAAAAIDLVLFIRFFRRRRGPPDSEGSFDSGH